MRGLMLLFQYSFNRGFQPFLNSPLLPAMSSPSATYCIVSLTYLTLVVNFSAFRFGHRAAACSTPVFYRRTLENILRVQQFTTHYHPVHILIRLPAE